MESFNKNDKIIYLSQDVTELVIVIGNDKFRLNQSENFL